MVNEQLRILLIAPPLTVVGGQSVQASRLYSHLCGISGLLMTFQPTTFVLKFLLFDLNQIPYVRTAINTLGYLSSLLRRIPQNDVIHVFTAGYNAFYLIAAPALLIGMLFRKKVILHYHDGRAYDHLTHSPCAVRVCRWANAIVTPTTFLVQVFARFGLQAIAISNILDSSRFDFRMRRYPRPVFLHNRGLEQEYNVECTLRAFQIVQNRYPEAQLVIAHDGSLRCGLDRAAQLLGLQNVTFTGAVSQDQMRVLYNSADVFVSSADHDNMPGSLLEAFAAGLPVIATNAGGTPWILVHDHSGLMVHCGDYQALAEGAFRLLEEPGLASRLSMTAREGLTRYSWDTIAREWIDLYSNLAKKACGFSALLGSKCSDK